MTSFLDLLAATGLLLLMFAVVCVPLALVVKVATKRANDEPASSDSEQPRQAA